MHSHIANGCRNELDCKYVIFQTRILKEFRMSDRFDLVHNDRFTRLLQQLRLMGADGAGVRRRLIAIPIIMYLPQLLLAAIDGVLFTSEPSASFLLDFAAITQYLVAIPLLLAADLLINPIVGDVVQHFRNSGVVRVDDREPFDGYCARAQRLVRSGRVDIMFLIGALLFAWSWIIPDLQRAAAEPDFLAWQVIRSEGGVRLSLPVLYAGVIASPFFLYLHFRWIWKAMIWTWLLRKVSRFHLRVHSFHPDRSGGLYFLSRAQGAFGILIFSVGCVIASTVGYNMLIKQADVMAIANILVLIPYVVGAPLVFLIPLLFFTPQLFWEKQKGLLEYSRLGTAFSWEFDARHLSDQRIETPKPAPKPVSRPGDFLEQGGNDIQTYNNYLQSFEAVRGMRVMPFDLSSLMQLVGAAAGPMLPLLTPFIPFL